MQVPEGKTKAFVKEDIYQEILKKGDHGYIDGYVQGADSRAYAVFVRKDGVIGMAAPYQLTAFY